MSDIHLRNLRFLESCTTRLSETAQHAGSDGEGSGESGLGATLSTQNPQHWNLQAVQKKHVGRGYTVLHVFHAATLQIASVSVPTA